MSRPKCPNHGEFLEGIPSPIPAKGEGICPISGVHFEFEAKPETEKQIKDHDGNITNTYEYDVTGDEDNSNN